MVTFNYTCRVVMNEAPKSITVIILTVMNMSSRWILFTASNQLTIVDKRNTPRFKQMLTMMLSKWGFTVYWSNKYWSTI